MERKSIARRPVKRPKGHRQQVASGPILRIHRPFGRVAADTLIQTPATPGLSAGWRPASDLSAPSGRRRRLLRRIRLVRQNPCIGAQHRRSLWFALARCCREARGMEPVRCTETRWQWLCNAFMDSQFGLVRHACRCARDLPDSFKKDAPSAGDFTEKIKGGVQRRCG